MYYYNRQANFIQSTPARGLLLFPEEFLGEYYRSDKRSAGFVKITDDGTTVTSCEWDEEAYRAWCAENPEVPKPEPMPTLADRVGNLEQSKANQADVDKLNEALNMILTGVTV